MNDKYNDLAKLASEALNNGFGVSVDEFVEMVKDKTKKSDKLIGDHIDTMINTPVPNVKGQLRLCDEGERLYNYYSEFWKDEDQCFTEEMKEAFNAWVDHKNACDKCGYV